MALLQSQQTRYHESVKPRFANPSFMSTNIGFVLGMSSSMPYRLREKVAGIQDILSTVTQPAETARVMPYSPYLAERKSQSHLSTYGAHSLSKLTRYITDKEVYNKQTKNYNIINVQPRDYEDTINVYPKYRLENIDSNFYKKQKIESEVAAKMLIRKESNVQKNIVQQKEHQNPEKDHYGNYKPIRGKYLNNVDQLKDII